jgi:nitroreductase
MDTFEAMGTARSMRWFHPDPVPDDMIEQVLWAATRASSPNNTQCWDFVVVTDPAQRAALGEAMAPFAAVTTAMPDPADATDQRTLQGARNLAARLAEVPVIIVICGRNIYPEHRPQEHFMWSAVYAAGQNLLVAARALGLGAAFTTFHGTAPEAFHRILGIPHDRHIGVTMPLGWPAGPVGPVTRKPLTEVVHRDRW